MTFEKDRMRAVRVKWGFYRSPMPGLDSNYGYWDIKVNMQVWAPVLPPAVSHLIEIQILLSCFLEVKKFMHILYKVARQDFTDRAWTKMNDESADSTGGGMNMTGQSN